VNLDTTRAILNILGLVLDIVGVVLIFRYGINISFKWGGVEAAKPYEIPHRKGAIIGLLCIVVGFAFQLAANALTFF